MKKLSGFNRILLILAALALISAYYFPIWQIKLWAPQYPEGLGMQIWIDRLTGNISSINNMNHYVGMREIDEAMFPEFIYLKYIIGSVIGVGLLAGIWGRRVGAYVFLALLILLGLGALVDMHLWGYDYGHNLDPRAAIKVPGMVYQPPLIGYKQLLNFLAYSGPHTAGWIMGGATVLVAWVVLLEHRFFGLFKKKTKVKQE